MRSIIIGDIHGCNKELCTLLEKVKPEKNDQIILLGDLFDRGPESWEVFYKVKSLEREYGDRFILLRGNHEEFLLKEKLTIKERMIWERVGKGTTVTSFKKHGEKMEEAIPWIEKHCRMYYKGNGFQCVHAGLLVDPIEANDIETMIHDHGIAMKNCYKGPLTIVGHIGIEKPTYYDGQGEAGKAVEYDEEMSLPENGVICIDTGCGKGGKLTAMVIEERVFRLFDSNS